MEYKNSFRQLVVWQKSKELTLFLYKITNNFPTEEKYALTSQIRRSSSSIMTNIAEGNAKKSLKDRCNYFNIAQGSIAELDCFIELAHELNYLDTNNYELALELINKTGFLLNKFIKAQK